MIKSGEFVDINLNRYKVFEMITTNFYRLDICDYSATEEFLVTNQVLFSKIVRKKEFIYGNEDLYLDYRNIIDTATSINQELVSDRKWQDGRFVFKQQRYLDDLHYYEISLVDGRPDREVYVYDSQYVALQLTQMESLKELLPYNFNKYISKDIGKKSDRVQTLEYISYDTLKTMYDIDHIEQCDYAVIQKEEEIEQLKKDLLKRERIAGFDTETDTLIWNMYSDSNLTGFILSARYQHSRYIPIAHTKFKSFDVQVYIDFMLWCRENNIVLTAHNTKFEMKIWLYYRYKIFLETKKLIPLMKIEHDSLEASVMNNSVVIKGAHSLKNLEELRSGKFYLELNHIFPGDIYFPILDIKTTKVYACPDSDNTVNVLEDELDKMRRLHPTMMNLYALECELTALKAQQEFYGMRVDEDATLRSSNVAKDNREILRKLIHKFVGSEIDIDKPRVVSDLMYEKLKCPILVRTKSGKPSTGAASLKKLSREARSKPSSAIVDNIKNLKSDVLVKASDLNRSKYPVLLLLQAYRFWNKQLTGFYERINRTKVNARLMFSINQNGTNTGRQSSSIHQIAKPIRHVILADSDDHDFIAADYMQMELRLYFSDSDETELMKLCEGYDVDIHRAIASAIQGKEMWDISAEERAADKARNFGVIYMMSGRGLALAKYGVGATDSQIKECADSIDAFFTRFKRCARHMKQTSLDAMTNLYSETLFGRIRHFEDLNSPNISSEKKASLLRQANNMPTQGTGADVMKIAEVSIEREIQKRGWDELVETPQGWLPKVRVMCSVHDEVLLSKHKSVHIEEVLEVLTECMEMRLHRDGKAWAPLYIGVKVGDNWGDGKRDDLDIPVPLRLKLIEEYKKTGVSAIKTRDTKNEMLSIINKFRDDELIGYMESLIEECGTDVEAIWQKLRHPSLTHELIARFPQSKESINTEGVWSHHERMRKAIASYLEFRSTSGDLQEKEINEKDKDIEVVDEIDLVTNLQEIAGLAEEFTEYDEKGNPYYEDEEDPTEGAEHGILTVDDIAEIYKRTNVKQEYILQFFDSIYIDTDTLYEDEVNEVIKMIWADRAKDGFYSVHIARNRETYKLPFAIEQFDSEEAIRSYIEKCSERKRTVTINVS